VELVRRLTSLTEFSGHYDIWMILEKETMHFVNWNLTCKVTKEYSGLTIAHYLSISVEKIMRRATSHYVNYNLFHMSSCCTFRYKKQGKLRQSFSGRKVCYSLAIQYWSEGSSQSAQQPIIKCQCEPLQSHSHLQNLFLNSCLHSNL